MLSTFFKQFGYRLISYNLHLNIKEKYSLFLLIAYSLDELLNLINFIIKLMNFFYQNICPFEMNEDGFDYLINFKNSKLIDKYRG